MQIVAWDLWGLIDVHAKCVDRCHQQGLLEVWTISPCLASTPPYLVGALHTDLAESSPSCLGHASRRKVALLTAL